MSKWLLMSVMVVPILAGLLPGKRRGWVLSRVVGGVLAFDLFYVALLYILGHQWG